jgi:hypothetical protein
MLNVVELVIEKYRASAGNDDARHDVMVLSGKQWG